MILHDTVTDAFCIMVPCADQFGLWIIFTIINDCMMMGIYTNPPGTLDTRKEGLARLQISISD